MASKQNDFWRLIEKMIVPPGKKISLARHYDPGLKPDFIEKDRAAELLAKGVDELAEMQDKLYAQNTYALLLIFQAMDAAGKDGVIKHVMSGINPQGCEVYSFKAPSSTELDHDYMWRTSRCLPERGRIGIFNRSYYEEVLITKVHPGIIQKQQLPARYKDKEVYGRRYQEINDFERYLKRQGIVTLKFFLNVSKGEQKKRFLERIERPDKNWKFSASDAKERAHWDEYMRAYSDCLSATSTKHAPWYVIPADTKWFTRLAVGAIILRTLKNLKLKYPAITEQQKKELLEAKQVLESEKYGGQPGERRAVQEIDAGCKPVGGVRDGSEQAEAVLGCTLDCSGRARTEIGQRSTSRMAQGTRRSWMKTNAAIAAAGAASCLPQRAGATQQGKIILSHVLNLNQPDRIKLCLQMGVTHVVSTPSLAGIGADQYEAAMRKHKEDWAQAGFKVAVYETLTPVPAANIKRGTPGRDEELKNWIAAIEAMGKVGIPVLCYNLGQPGRRTGSVVVRGGAISTAHDYEASKKLPPAREIYTEDQLWEALTWLIERVIPICEKANVKMGYHPNDPSVSPFLGSAQIMISPAAYRRLFAIADSPYNGVSFCQGNFRSMRYAPGESIYSVATEFAEKRKIQFVHFRDIDGTADTRYHETFHDDGPTDMARMLQCYVRGGFSGPLRTDHAPAMEGEDSQKNPGYAMLGHIHAIGYTKGLMQALNIAYE